LARASSSKRGRFPIQSSPLPRLTPSPPVTAPQALADARIAQDSLIKGLQHHPVFKTLPADVIAVLVTKFEPYIFNANEEIYA
jgi:hypothetical protein